MALAVAHVCSFGLWVVEDAAISFAYARNWADGHGLVPLPGGERVEGYSNFTWVVLLAAGRLLGVAPLWTAKIAAIALTAATVPVVYRLGRLAAPRRPAAAGLLAATLFAATSQVGIFGAAGLENPLFNALLALGLAWGAEEAAHGSWPRSALAFFAIAISRPEGIGYAAVAGLWALIWTIRARRGLQGIGAWLLLFFVPFGLYHGVRYAYFAWPFPMTYYAKVHAGPVSLLQWNGSGWLYARHFAAATGQIVFGPLAVAGAVGPRAWSWPAGPAAMGAGIALAAAIVDPFGLLPATWGVGALRAAAAIAMGAAVVVASARSEAAHVRAPCWSMAFGSLLFAIYAQGDWMGGFRWMSLLAVPAAVLIASALADLMDAIAARWVGVVAAVAAVAWFFRVHASYTLDFHANPEITPYAVRNRLAQVEAQALGLHLDVRPRVMTFDMGAFLLWSEGMDVIDAGGLTNVPIAVAPRPRARLLQEYIYTEQRPDLIHIPVHAMATIRRSPQFASSYLQIHPSAAVRRDRVFGPTPRPSAPHRVAFGVDNAANDAIVAGLGVVSPEASDHVTVDLDLTNPAASPFRCQLVLADATGDLVAAWPIEPAYGWIDPHRGAQTRSSRAATPSASPPSSPRAPTASAFASSTTRVPSPPISPARPTGSPPTARSGSRTSSPSSPPPPPAAPPTPTPPAPPPLAAEGRCEDATAAWRAAKRHLPTERFLRRRHRPCRPPRHRAVLARSRRHGSQRRHRRPDPRAGVRSYAAGPRRPQRRPVGHRLRRGPGARGQRALGGGVPRVLDRRPPRPEPRLGAQARRAGAGRAVRGGRVGSAPAVRQTRVLRTHRRDPRSGVGLRSSCLQRGRPTIIALVARPAHDHGAKSGRCTMTQAATTFERRGVPPRRLALSARSLRSECGRGVARSERQQRLFAHVKRAPPHNAEPSSESLARFHRPPPTPPPRACVRPGAGRKVSVPSSSAAWGAAIRPMPGHHTGRPAPSTSARPYAMASAIPRPGPSGMEIPGIRTGRGCGGGAPRGESFHCSHGSARSETKPGPTRSTPRPGICARSCVASVSTIASVHRCSASGLRVPEETIPASSSRDSRSATAANPCRSLDHA